MSFKRNIIYGTLAVTLVMYVIILLAINRLFALNLQPEVWLTLISSYTCAVFLNTYRKHKMELGKETLLFLAFLIVCYGIIGFVLFESFPTVIVGLISGVTLILLIDVLVKKFV